jgi:hypothetical protein
MYFKQFHLGTFNYSKQRSFSLGLFKGSEVPGHSSEGRLSKSIECVANCSYQMIWPSSFSTLQADWSALGVRVNTVTRSSNRPNGLLEDEAGKLTNSQLPLNKISKIVRRSSGKPCYVPLLSNHLNCHLFYIPSFPDPLVLNSPPANISLPFLDGEPSLANALSFMLLQLAINNNTFIVLVNLRLVSLLF